MGWRELTSRGVLLGAVVMTGATGAVASGQTTHGLSLWELLRPTEPGRSDIGPLGVESRQISSDLRQDWDFETLYRGQGIDGQVWFARRNAGITAVFPRSVYVDGGSGSVAAIPPDTTFVIGEPNEYTSARLGLTSKPGPVRDASGGLRIDSRLSLRYPTLIHPVQAMNLRDQTSARKESPRQGIANLLRMAVARERRGR